MLFNLSIFVHVVHLDSGLASTSAGSHHIDLAMCFLMGL